MHTSSLSHMRYSGTRGHLLTRNASTVDVVTEPCPTNPDQVQGPKRHSVYLWSLRTPC